MAQFNTNIFSQTPSLIDLQRLQEDFELKKQMAVAQLFAAQPKPDSLSLKDKIELGLKARELDIKGMGEQITTSPFEYQPQNGQNSNLINAVIRQESGGDPNAVSPKNAQGLMQIMPNTARDPGFGVTPLQNWDGQNPMSAPPKEQIRFGTDYLNAMIAKNGGNIQLGLAAYNAGQGAVQKNGGIPPYKETQDYVRKISADIGQPQQSNAKPLYQNGKPFTTGLQAGFQWYIDAAGNRVAQKIPGTPLSKDEADQSKQKTAKVKLDDTLLEMQDLYEQLYNEGQIRNNSQGKIANVLNYYQNNEILGGKQLGDLYNTPASSIRERIDAAKSRAAALYIDAAGLTSGQTNAAAEQERFLKSLGGFDKNYESNQQILEGVSRTYGAGSVKGKSINKEKNSNTVDYKEYFK